MDVTPQLIEQIDFSEKFRGYDPDQVDDFLERVGATIAELSKTSREALQRAERAEAALRAAPEQAPAETRPQAAVMSDEEEAMQSTRTLMMAKRTADAAIADARQEAQKLVADARSAAEQQAREAQTEADRIVGEARVNADQMTQKATAEANREYGARRDQILAEIGDLENRKVGIAGQLVAIESRLEEYRTSLSSIHGAVGAVLDDPENALRSPLPGIDVAALARPVVEAASTESPADTPSFETDPEPYEFRSSDESSFAPEPASSSSFGEPAVADTFDAGESVSYDTAYGESASRETAFSEPAFSEPAFSEPAFSEPAFSEPAFSEPAFSEPAFTESAFSDEGFRDAPAGDQHFGDATLLDPNDLAVPYAAEASTASDLPWGDEGAAPAADPWGPGSWGEVAAFSDDSGAFAPESEAFEPGGAATGSHAFSEFPSEGLPVIGQDRYTRDLDQAVNQPDESHDDAMTAFFEGDDEQQTRRFGRRR